LRAADHDRLPLERLRPERPERPAAVGDHPQVAILPDAADDEPRLAQRARHQPPRLSGAGGEHHIAEGVPGDGKPRQASGDEVGGGPLSPRDGGDIQKSADLLVEGDGAKTWRQRRQEKNRDRDHEFHSESLFVSLNPYFNKIIGYPDSPRRPRIDSSCSILK
jgi:hypothetical protein